MLKNLTIKGKTYKLPIYLPDATRAVTKSVDSLDLIGAGVKGAVVNTYHLMTQPGITVLEKFNGVKSFMNFNGLIASDSGGWQIFSLIHRNKNLGTITDKGVTFSFGGGKKKLFSPEKSIETQFSINSDIVICLDDFTSPTAKENEIKESVERTIRWAKASKIEYLRQIELRKLTKNESPLIFAVIQGGMNKELRKYCAEKLIEIGFDGYGFGGYVIDEGKGLNLEISKYIADLIPNDKIKFALGTGTPIEIANLYEMGWDIFDCTLPTRDGRHKRLYTFTQEPKSFSDLKNPETYKFVHIDKEIYRRDESPISEFCDCHTCKNFTKAYLHHLFNIEDTLAYRLATIHNLRTYTKLIEVLSY